MPDIQERLARFRRWDYYNLARMRAAVERWEDRIFRGASTPVQVVVVVVVMVIVIA